MAKYLVTHYYHSGFSVAYEETLLVFDYWRGEDGELPEGISAGVLSEDLVYDQITEVRDAAFRMLELAADILKNRI